MDLQIANQLFVVCGATSGLGYAITHQLLSEGAFVLAVARNEEKLLVLQKRFHGQFEYVCGDIFNENIHQQIIQQLSKRVLHGCVINAGGPPAKTFMETTAFDWDNAYNSVLRWKVLFTKSILPTLLQNGYGRLLFIESATVKQPLENMVLSNSLRAAVVGMVKTLAQEVAYAGITANVLAPGSHNTPAIERVYLKKSEQTGLSVEAIRAKAKEEIPVKFLGNANDFASLATWLLSPFSRYITGQTISVDGGSVKGIMG